MRDEGAVLGRLPFPGGNRNGKYGVGPAICREERGQSFGVGSPLL